MAKYIARRVFYMFITLFLIATATFFLMKTLPGSPIASASKLTPDQLAVVEAKYGLNEPLPVQYGKYMLNLAQGDLGNSFQFKGASVTDLIINRLGPSFLLGAQGMILGVLIGIVLGMIAALRQNTIWDYGSTLIAIIGISIPSFVFATTLQYWFGVQLGWFPVALWKDGWMSSVLPSIALAMGPLAIASRFIRTEMIEVLSSDYITLARSKGASGFEVAFKHAFRNALIPLVTVLGPVAAGLLTGSLVIEQIFAIPGIGEQFVKAIMINDYSIIMGTTLFFSVFLIFIILVVDVLYGVIDPRIRLSGGNS
ncbi:MULTISPECIES: oligopeptide ABC transporter permease [Paenisporosarcina]|jgi:oligopeptide transport system permease protein|uniref:ABC transporter permease n=1 Tax=Paenisporosarcina quisquiliarum TaxID=365346 RepID=A0A9X3LEK2_9BACL|nr:oligopeptide ABC transporter permease [Paenisporosarcina quisquiliarum]MCZ8536570.1 ABC transporter permease [Paenisporosarcina quisquiliarum]